MNFEEHAAKPLLAAAGIATPPGAVASSADEAEAIARRIGACVVKAQVPTGKRGKAGGIKLAATPEAAAAAAGEILGMEIGGHRVARVLVEAQVSIAAECYAAVLNDPESKGPLLLFSAIGGMEIEALTATRPNALLRLPIDIRRGPLRGEVEPVLAGLGLDGAVAAAASALVATAPGGVAIPAAASRGLAACSSKFIASYFPYLAQ